MLRLNYWKQRKNNYVYCVLDYKDNSKYTKSKKKCISGVMVSVLASSVINRRDRDKPKTIKLVFVAAPLSTQH